MTKHKHIDLRSVKLPRTANTFLAAPRGYCTSATPHMEAPVFSLSQDALWDRVLHWVNAEPRIAVHEQDKAGFYLDFTQRSRVFGFPDRVTIALLPAGQKDASTIAVYSRSTYGRRDMGVNQARVLRLFDALKG
jgi:uncharacterized protein (DUF1499 family)